MPEAGPGIGRKGKRQPEDDWIDIEIVTTIRCRDWKLFPTGIDATANVLDALAPSNLPALEEKLMTLEKNEIITGIKLKKMFGPHASNMGVMGFVEPLRRSKRGENKSYTILKPLPSNEEFQQLLRAQYTFTVQELISDAFDEFESLHGELADWYDNLPEGLQDSNKGSMLEDASCIMENLNEAPEISEKLGNLKIVSLPSRMHMSRSGRCAAACESLRNVIELLEDENEITARLKDDGEVDRLISQAKEAASELRNVIVEAENVEFPGMNT